MAAQDILVRLRMLGVAAFNSQAKSASSSVKDIGDATDQTSRKTGKFGGSMGKLGGAFGMIASVGATAGAAIGAAGIAAAGMGVKFNASMEQSEVAFTNLLGSSKEAKGMLDELYQLAAKTPFEFPQLTQASQRMLGFGMAAKDVIPTMTAVGDAVAAAGGGAEQIDRVSTAIGQMQAKGKVSSEELLQLAESGVPAFKLLADQLGLTGEQLSKKLQQGAITAEKGIPALVKGINKQYGGMAKEQSKTFSGMLSSIKDQAMGILGKATMPLFKFMKDRLLPIISKVVDAVDKWVKGGGLERFMTKLKPAVAEGKRLFTQFLDALKPLEPFIRNILWPILKVLAKNALTSLVVALKILIPLIKFSAKWLGWLGTKAKPLAPYIEKFGAAMNIGNIIKAVIPLIRSVAAWFGRLVDRVKGIPGAVSRAMSSLWEKVKSTASNLVSKFRDLGRDIITSLVEGIKSAPSKVIDALKSLVPEKLRGAVSAAIPGMARGGTLRAGNTALVGERGPEVITTDRTIRVLPIPGVASMAGAGGVFGDTIVPVNIDGREVMRVVARRTADSRARR